MMEYIFACHPWRGMVCKLFIIYHNIYYPYVFIEFFQNTQRTNNVYHESRETNNVLINETYLIHCSKTKLILCLFFLRTMQVVKAKTYWIELSWTNSVRSTEQTCPHWLFLAYSYHIDQKFRIHMLTFNKWDREIVLFPRSCISCCSKTNYCFGNFYLIC